MTIFMLHNVFSVIYRRVKAKREKKDGRGNVTAKRGMICHPCLLWMAWLRSRNSRISALSARTYVVIPSLHWEGRGGLGVNTSRGLSLSFLCRWEAAPRSTMHLCSLEAPPPPNTAAIFSAGSGGHYFPTGGKLFFFFFSAHIRRMHYGLWMKNRSFSMCIPLGFCSYRGPVNEKSASL